MASPKTSKGIVLMPVKSSRLKALGYDAASATMAVVFHSGDAVYHYAGVTPDEYNALRSAASIGSRFSTHFRKKPFSKA